MYIFASQQFLVYGARIEPKNLVHCSVTLPDLLVTGQRHRKTEFEYLLKEDSFKLYIVDFLHAKLHAYFTISFFSFLACLYFFLYN